jgi:Fic family protein
LQATSFDAREWLTRGRLFGWHAALFPTGRSGMKPIRVGKWRDDGDGPKQVISGPIGREQIHFKAPAAGRLDGEIDRFLESFNGNTETERVAKAGIAHLWFATIHPFDDGNGRIARDRGYGARTFRAQFATLLQHFVANSPERAAYYNILEETQHGTLETTPWMERFLGCLGRAVEGAQTTLADVLYKARFRESVDDFPLNERQRLVPNHLLNGCEGKLTTSKWAKLAKCSQDTALRDIEGLIAYGILARNPQSGRSTGYELVKNPGVSGSKQGESQAEAKRRQANGKKQFMRVGGVGYRQTLPSLRSRLDERHLLRP